MENVSKFVLMAATILLSVLIVCMFVYIFKSGSSVSETYDRKQQVEQLELYNSKFEAYVKDNTILDLVSLFNLAYSVNIASNYDSNDAVEIIVEYSAKNLKISIPNTGDEKLKKNEVFINGTKKSMYELLNSNLDGFDDKLTTTKLDNNNTIYKYLFSCKNIEYNKKGKVSKMKFEMYINSKF